MTNPEGQTRTDSADVQGSVNQAQDTYSKLSQFAYDPFGNLNQTIDPTKNVVTVVYDRRGRNPRLIDYGVDARSLTK